MADAIVGCVVCDLPVMVSLQVWNTTPVPAALCDDCDEQTSWPVMRAIYLLRCQLTKLTQQGEGT